MIILLDTNVFIAACIYIQVKDYKIKIRHKFYDQSIKLLSLIKKHDHVTGMTTKTVKGETFAVFNKALENVIHDNTFERKTLYDNRVAITNKCYKKIQEFFTYVDIKNLNDDDVKCALEDVKKMADELICLYKRNYEAPLTRNIAAKRRTHSIQGARWKWGLKVESYNAHMRQIELERLQMKKFALKHPNINDMRILSESIIIKKIMDENNFLIASCDTGFFSPIRTRKGSISNIVTKKIYDTFNIDCDVPNQVITTCKL